MIVNSVRFGLVVPTFNAGSSWSDFLASLEKQSVQPSRRLIIDSSSTDRTAPLAKDAGFEVITIAQSEFDHGGTRQQGFDAMADCDVVIFVTQDILFPETTVLEQLLMAFMKPEIGAAYGRQLPFPDANLSERNSRTFNYPPESQVKSLADRKRLGLKTAFLSNSFAAYRREAFDAVGGFPARQILGEDMYVAGKLLLADWKVAYCSDAAVFHSHNQSLWKVMRRSFDTGVFHDTEPWLLETFTSPEGEGVRLVVTEIKRFWRENPFSILQPVVRNALRFCAYRLGRLHRFLPIWFNRFFSLNRLFWRV